MDRHNQAVDISDHYALTTADAPLPDGRSARLTVVDLGELHVASGRLGACDPFVNLDAPVVTPITPGRYPVRVTIADVSEAQDGSHLREAYLSVVLSEADSVSIEPAPSQNGTPLPDQFWGVPVDAGTVGFVDANAVTRCMPGDGVDWYSDIFDSGKPDSWFAQMDSESSQPAGTANIVLPLATRGENLIISHSGWGDGFYPLTQTFAADGTATAVHIDLLVVGPAEESEGEVIPDEEQPTAVAKRGLARFFGRRG